MANQPTAVTGGERYIPYAERTGKVAIKLHTGEPHGPNIIPPAWVKAFMARELPDATIIDGDRYTTEQNRETLKINGWTDLSESSRMRRRSTRCGTRSTEVWPG